MRFLISKRVLLCAKSLFLSFFFQEREAKNFFQKKKNIERFTRSLTFFTFPTYKLRKIKTNKIKDSVFGGENEDKF